MGEPYAIIGVSPFKYKTILVYYDKIQRQARGCHINSTFVLSCSFRPFIETRGGQWSSRIKYIYPPVLRFVATWNGTSVRIAMYQIPKLAASRPGSLTFQANFADRDCKNN